MAPQVTDIIVHLGITGDKDLDRLKNVFKDLTSTIDITDTAIGKAKNAVETYIKTANNSEAVIKGQITAFERLKSQADVTGTAYQTLDNDIKVLKQQLIGASTSLLSQRDALVKNANSTKASSSEVSNYVTQLKKLQEQTRASSQAFNTIESDIASLTLKMQQLRKEEMADFGKNAVNATKNALTGLQTGVQQSISLFTRLGEQSKTAFGQVARTVEGITALSVGGAVAGGGAGALGGLASMLQGGGSSLAGIKAALGNLPIVGGQAQQLISPDAIARLTEAASNVSALQAKVIGLDQAMGAVTGAFSSLGPSAGAAAIAASTGIAIIYDSLRKEADKTRVELEQSFVGIDDEVQNLLRSLTKLRDQIQGLSMTKINELLGEARQRFAAAPAGTPLSRSMASQIAGLESVQRKEAAAQADVLEEYRQRVRGTSTAVVDLNQRLSYLKSRLSEVDTSTIEGRAQFAQLSNESVQLSEQIRKLGDSYQHVSLMARQAANAQADATNRPTSRSYLSAGIASAERQAMAELGARVRAGVEGTPLLLPAAGQTSSPETGTLRSRSARLLAGQVETTFEPNAGARIARTLGMRAGYYNPPTAATGAAAAVGQAAQVATTPGTKAYSDVLVNLRNVLLASDNTIKSLNNQRSAWNALREAVDPAGKQFTNATRRIEQLDERINALQLGGGARRPRLTTGQAVQTAGAVISGGIFGGAEGFLGGLGGAALGLAIPGLGAVGGAFAGSAAGAQVGMLRQQLGGTAEYAASIEKLQIALRGVAGSQAAYQQAIAAAAAATRDLNIPQEEATRGLTRLSAAVIGAGGTIGDASMAFRAMSSAIKATGGGAEQVDGALLALTQVFSKGKVSAEELNQIAERLPGTFTLFAKATGRTGPELTKALEQGKVSLNDLMKFLDAAQGRYGQTALKMAASSQDAGTRMTIAFQALQLEIGKALEPLGAKFQAAFAGFIKDISPSVVSITKGISEALQFLFDNKTAASASAFALNVGLVTAGFIGLRAAIQYVQSLNIAAWFATTSTSAKITGDVMLTSATSATRFSAAAQGLFTALSQLAALGVVTVGINYIQTRVKEALDINALAERESEGGAARQFQGATRETVLAAQEAQRRNLYRLGRQEAKFQQNLQNNQLLYQIPGLNAVLAQGSMEEQLRRSFETRFAQGVLSLDPSKFPKTRPPSSSSSFPSPVATGTGSTSEAKAAAREAAQDLKERQKLLRELEALSDKSQRPIVLSKKKILDYDLAIQKANSEGLGIEATRLEILKSKYSLDEEVAKLRVEETKQLDESAKNVDQTNRALRDQVIAARTLQKIREKEFDFSRETQLREAQIAASMKKQRESLAASLMDRRRELGLVSRREYNAALRERERKRLASEAEGATPEQRAQALDLYRQQIDPTFFESITQQVGKLRDGLDELANGAAVVKGAAQSIGESFSDSFKNVVSGTATAQEALAGFFQSVANYFLDMASKIIAKWIEMALLNTVLSLFPSGQSAISGPGIPSPEIMAGVNKSSAKGNVFAANGIVPYAMGGIVTRPTLFPFAAGGTVGTGLMGEAGPEAIMPLRRGPDGRLGVSSGGGGGAVSVTVNVDATGSQVQGNAGQGAALGRAVSQAVQAELIKQRRPGGLLAS